MVRHYFSGVRRRLMFSYFPGAVDWLVKASTARARFRIKRAGAEKILVDNTIIGHSIVQETAQIDTGTKLWGGKIEVPTGYLTRIPVYSDDDTGSVAASVQFIPGIASLAKRGAVRLFDTPELRDEQLDHPIGRYSGYGWFDYSLLSGVEIDTIPDSQYRLCIAPSYTGVPSPKEQRKARLSAKTDELFRALVRVLGQSNSQDAWHITVAEKTGCYCFLTMDFTLVEKTLPAQKNNPVISSLKTRIMTPEQYGIEFGLVPISPRLYAYHGASFPVHPELNWPLSGRRNRPTGPSRRPEVM